MKKQVSLLSAAIVSVLASAPAQAIQFDGFMTAGAAQIVSIDEKHKHHVYAGGVGDRGISKDLSFEKDTRFGLQVSSDISENMSVVAQILGRGDQGNFNAIIEWAYIDYEFHETTSLHVGKIKQPVYLVNDYVEVGYAYPWIRPPQEVYLLNNPLNTVNGIELLFQTKLGPGMISFQPYLGSNRDDIPNAQGSYFEAENIYGADLKYSGRGYTVHGSAFQCNVKTTGGFAVPAANNMIGQDLAVDMNGNGDCKVMALGFNFDLANVVMYAEWTKRTTTEELSRAFGDTEGYYATIGYRFGKWLPHLTYAGITGKASTYSPGAVQVLDSNGDPVPGANFNFPAPLQTSITAGLRYEVNDSAALKVEYMVVDVNTDANDLADANAPLSPQGYLNYGLFNTDLTMNGPDSNVGIVSVALDVIF